MCQVDTGSRARRLLVVSVAACAVALGQTASDSVRPDWRKVGSTALEVMLASPATGPVNSVWFGPDGRTLYARTHAGRVFETDFYPSGRSGSQQSIVLPVASLKRMAVVSRLKWYVERPPFSKPRSAE